MVKSKEDVFKLIVPRLALGFFLLIIAYFFSLMDPFYQPVMVGYTLLGWFLLLVDWIYSKPTKSLSRRLFPKVILVCVFIIFVILLYLINWIFSNTQQVTSSFEALIFLYVLIALAFAYIGYLLLHKIENDLSKGKGNFKLREKLEDSS